MKGNIKNKKEGNKQTVIKLSSIKQTLKKIFFLVYIKMLEITRKNCFKCDLETIINNDSQHVWINLRDFDAETESKGQNMSNKHDNASNLKYRRQLTPNIKFQHDRIFVRNDLFEQIIKSCKATNAEFTILKEKLGICPYEEDVLKFNH